MKVLHVHGHDFWWPLPEGADTRLRGGVEAYLAGVLPALQQRGWEVAVLRCSALPPPPDSTRPGQFYEVRMSGLRYRRSTGAGLERVLAEVRPDLVHLHSVYYALHPRMLRRLLATWPVVYTLHDVDPICFRKTKLRRDGTLCDQPIGLGCLTSGCHRPREKRGWLRGTADLFLNPRQLPVYRRLPVVLVPSTWLRDQLLLNGFDPLRVHVLRNFLRFAAPPPCAVPATSGAPLRILFAGRLTADKGVFLLTEALSRLPASPPWELVVAGTGPDETAFRAHVCARGLGGRAHFAGQLSGPQLAAEYARCDLVVVPSLQPESFGLVGIEAHAFGKPVVGFRAGGIAEWLDHEETGLVARHGDAADLARQLARLLTAPELRARLGETGRARALQRFDPAAHVERLLEHYAARLAPARQGAS